ncbi:putative branched-chain amino acid transport system II carrier protein [Chlamydiales bacterium STE3]|nr:putative branched-chain amino acid transport system II carrier protein [Chlamydiales bacterium STE3]
MKRLLQSESIAIGLAMFSMFFGAGNIIFPLAVGQYAGDKNLFAILGLLLTAVAMPITGLIAMLLYEGDYHQFFGRLGKVPGFLIALMIISLLGPLGSTPRCIALAYTTLKSTFPQLSQIFFSACSCFLIFLFTIRRSNLLKLLGWVLTPFLLVSLATIIVMGLFTPPTSLQLVNESSKKLFWHGLKEGYNTMDLLAAFFFSSTILSTLRLRVIEQGCFNASPIKIALSASIVGAALLAAVYLGFSYLAAFHGADLHLTAKDEILAAITFKIAGPHAGILVCLTIALACLTTAIALISAFTDFIHKEVLSTKISYQSTLIASLLITFFISTFEFSGISAFLSPILQTCYPGLIVLTFLNIAFRLKKVQPI